MRSRVIAAFIGWLELQATELTAEAKGYAAMATSPLIEPKRRSSQFLTDSFQQGLALWNRARLAPQFPHEWNEALFEREDRNFTRFYDAVRALARQSAAERQAALQALDPTARPPSSP